ncbi:MAG: hypothetical protein ACOYEV_19640, partial [Candidatus Nanopelagicales bacterium]
PWGGGGVQNILSKIVLEKFFLKGGHNNAKGGQKNSTQEALSVQPFVPAAKAQTINKGQHSSLKKRAKETG